MIKKRLKYSMAVCFAAAAVLIPQLTAMAETGGIINWTKGSTNEQVSISLNVPKIPETTGDITALQIDLSLDVKNGGSINEAKFAFDSKITGASDITIHDYVFDESESAMTLFVAGNDKAVADQGSELRVGVLTVKADKDVVVSLTQAEVVADGELIVLADADDLESSYTITKTSGNGNGSGSGSGSRGSSGTRNNSVNRTGYAEPQVNALETEGTWEQQGDLWKFKFSSGSYAADCWIFVKGEWYHINKNAVMDIGWYQQGSWYYLKPSGAMKKGWLDLSGVWYHLDETSGKMTTGWRQDGGLWYYLLPNGAMGTGWQMINEKWYYLNPVKPTPVPVKDETTGIITETTAGQRPYGSMYQSEKTPDGYEVDDSGAMR